MTFNSSLADEVIGQIEAHPELHRQQMWATKTDCGTAYCFAGWVCALNGMTEENIEWTKHSFSRIGYNYYDNGSILSIKDAARDLLGIDNYQAGELFNSFNSVEEIKRLVKEFANGE